MEVALILLVIHICLILSSLWLLKRESSVEASVLLVFPLNLVLGFFPTKALNGQNEMFFFSLIIVTGPKQGWISMEENSAQILELTEKVGIT